MNDHLLTYVRTNVLEAVKAIPEGRRALLDQLVDYLKGEASPQLVFICTHNSRRSHLSQIWAGVAAAYYKVEAKTFSGGTVATAFNPNAVAALRRAGLEVDIKKESDNPVYQVRIDDDLVIEAYSKVFDQAPNPTKGFAAIMTCSEADAECPVVFGADKRVKLFYEDPKAADGTPQQDEVYDARCLQIAIEMFYIFQLASEQHR